MLPSPGVIAVAREALASLGGRVFAWEGMLPSPGVIGVTGEALASLASFSSRGDLPGKWID